MKTRTFILDSEWFILSILSLLFNLFVYFGRLDHATVSVGLDSNDFLPCVFQNSLHNYQRS